MTRRSNAVVGSLLAALLAWELHDAISPEDRSPARRLVSCDPARVTEIAVERPAGSIRASRRIPGWTFAEGGRFGERAVPRLVETICAAEVLDTVDAAGRLGQFGLDPPRGRILVRQGDREWRVDVGSATPAGNRVYVRYADGERVLVVGAALGLERDDSGTSLFSESFPSG